MFWDGGPGGSGRSGELMGFVGLVGLVGLLGLLGLVGQVGLMIPRYSKIQREFQLEVWTLTFQKYGHLHFVFVTNPRNSETKSVAHLCDASSELVLRYRKGY